MNPRNFAIVFTVAAQFTSAFQPRVLSSLASTVRHSSSASSLKMDSGLTLYGSQQTRSPLVNWYLEEMFIPYTQKAPRPSPHPFGQVPFLTDNGGVEVFESGAILLYIADAYGGTSEYASLSLILFSHSIGKNLILLVKNLLPLIRRVVSLMICMNLRL